MIDGDKRKRATSFDERTNEAPRLNHKKFDMINQLLSTNHEINRKVEEIANMRFENNQLKNELRDEKEINEMMNILGQVMRQLDEQIKTQRRPHDTNERVNLRLFFDK